MMTLRNYHPIEGPYRRPVRWLEVILSILAHAAIGAVLAYAVLGMAGAWDEAQACVHCVERMGK